MNANILHNSKRILFKNTVQLCNHVNLKLTEPIPNKQSILQKCVYSITVANFMTLTVALDSQLSYFIVRWQ